MLCFLPINTLTLGLLPTEEVKNASGLYNLMRNLGGAIGLAVANTQMIYLTKAHYATLRESMTATHYLALDRLTAISQSLQEMNLPDSDLAALGFLTKLTLREAEVMTFNILFQVISLMFVASLLVAPLLKKVEKKTSVILE